MCSEDTRDSQRKALDRRPKKLRLTWGRQSGSHVKLEGPHLMNKIHFLGTKNSSWTN